MKLAVTGPLTYPLGPASQGGIQTFCYLLAEELIKRGHEVDLYAIGSSTSNANLISVAQEGIRETELKENQQAYYEVALTTKLFELLTSKQPRYDVIHNNVINYSGFLQASTLPNCFTTFHIPTEAFHYRLATFADRSINQANYVAISDFQTKNKEINFIGRVHNGIALDQFDFVETPESYLTWLGRIEPRKGLLEAIALANELKVTLKFGGSSWDKKYYEQVIMMVSQSIINIGQVNPTERNILLGHARALLLPLQWDEPFGLVMIEAMACGTPIIAYDRGSVREIVDDGITGYIVPPNDVEAMKNAIRTVMNMSTPDYQAMRLACRARVEAYFTIEKMVDGYEKIYNKLGTS